MTHLLKIVLGVLILVSIIYACSNVVSPIVHNIPNISDYTFFPSRVIENNSDQVFNFHLSQKNYHLGSTIHVDSKTLDPVWISLDALTELHNTTAFLIVRNDSLIYEKYQNGFTDTSFVASFSVAKAFISTLIGIAIDEGLIKNVHQTVPEFLPEFESKPGFENVTIEHLLNHTSGIKFNHQEFNPYSDNAKFYYDKNLRNLTFKAKLDRAPGTYFNYSSTNPQLLALILERVSGKTVSTYFEEKLWSKIGTEHSALWSTDEKDSLEIEKAFCCIYALPVDFAKFGRLYLHNGWWNNEQVVSSTWVKETITPSLKNGSKINYHYNFGIGPADYGSFFPIGLYGQLIYVYPKKNVIIARFGDNDLEYDPMYWKEVMLQIVDQL